MKIALDAMGGDHAPKEIVLGALDALQKYEMLDKIYLVGQRDKIEAELSQNNGLQHAKIEIVEASEVIEMADHPANAYRRKKDASITVATRLVKEGTADAVVSAGSTGGQMVAALFGLGRIKGHWLYDSIVDRRQIAGGCRCQYQCRCRQSGAVCADGQYLYELRDGHDRAESGAD